MDENVFYFKDVAYIAGMIVSIGGVYWNLVRRVDKKANKEDVAREIKENTKTLTDKLDNLITTVNQIGKDIGEHIAYEKGKEAQKYESSNNERNYK